MPIDDFAMRLETLRKKYVSSMTRLLAGTDMPCFTGIAASNRQLQCKLEKLKNHLKSPRIQRKCEGIFTCTFVGASSQGKTAILSELFPDLSDPDQPNGSWLQKGVTDTTAQCLDIHYSEEPAPVVIDSYTYEELVSFLCMSTEEAENRGIRYSFDNSNRRVTVHGDNMEVDPEVKREFKFCRDNMTLELRPFSTPYEIPQGQENSNIICSLTTKKAPITTPFIPKDNPCYNALQLRALVKTVHLSSNYSRLMQLANNGDPANTAKRQSILKRLRFVDTPGQGTDAALGADEVLFYALGQKSKAIVVELWRHDELDFLIHVMLCNGQSKFQELWKEIENKLDPQDCVGLEERLILLMNSVRDFIQNPEIAKYYTHPELYPNQDQFSAVLKENALDKMSTRGTLRPKAICFLETMYGYENDLNRYRNDFQRYTTTMRTWTHCGQPGYDTLESLNLTGSFCKNLDDLENADSRGQGFFLNTILDMIMQQGPLILYKKHIERSGMSHMLTEILNAWNFIFTEEGLPTEIAGADQMKQFKARLQFNTPKGIDIFCEDRIDSQIDTLVQELARNHEDLNQEWCPDLFIRVCKVLETSLLQNKPPQIVRSFILNRLESLSLTNTQSWGYKDFGDAGMDVSSNIVQELLKHMLKVHVREILNIIFPKEIKNCAIKAINSDEQRNIVEMRHELESLQNDIQDIKKSLDI